MLDEMTRVLCDVLEYAFELNGINRCNVFHIIKLSPTNLRWAENILKWCATQKLKTNPLFRC